MQNKTDNIVVDVPRPLLLLGASLIVTGLIIVFYTASQILQVYQATDSNIFISNMRNMLSGEVLIKIRDESITIGEAVATTSAIALFSILAWVGIALGGGLIRSGANIISPVFRTELAALKLKLNSLLNKSNQ